MKQIALLIVGLSMQVYLAKWRNIAWQIEYKGEIPRQLPGDLGLRGGGDGKRDQGNLGHGEETREEAGKGWGNKGHLQSMDSTTKYKFIS